METTRVYYFKKFKTGLFVAALMQLLILTGIINAQDTYTIKGVCKVHDEGELYVYLIDKEMFKTPMKGIKKLVYPITNTNNQLKDVSFAFHNIPNGTYAIRCFIDENGNKKLDRGIFGPREPWGMSFREKRLKGKPSFSDIKFKAENSIIKKIIIIK